MCRSVAGVLGFGWREGSAERGAASEVGADHAEVEAVVVGGRGRSLSSASGEVTRASERDGGRRKMLLPLSASPLHRFASSGRRSFTAATAKAASALPQPSLAPEITTWGGDELNGGRAVSVGAIVVVVASSWDGVGRFFLRVSKLFGSQPR